MMNQHSAEGRLNTSLRSKYSIVNNLGQTRRGFWSILGALLNVNSPIKITDEIAKSKDRSAITRCNGCEREYLSSEVYRYGNHGFFCDECSRRLSDE
jgi:hypothetical protein